MKLAIRRFYNVYQLLYCPGSAPQNKKAYGFIRKPLFLWWVWLDSNQRPRDYESPALTD